MHREHTCCLPCPEPSVGVASASLSPFLVLHGVSDPISQIPRKGVRLGSLLWQSHPKKRPVIVGFTKKHAEHCQRLPGPGPIHRLLFKLAPSVYIGRHSMPPYFPHVSVACSSWIGFIHRNRYFLMVALRPSRGYFEKSYFLFHQLSNVDDLDLKKKQ